MIACAPCSPASVTWTGPKTWSMRHSPALGASWRKVRKHPAPRAWIVRTALNAGVPAWRRRRREVQFGETVRPADATSGGVVDRDIMAALRRLPERQRQVIALRLFLS